MILDKENVLNKLLKGFQMRNEVLIEGEEHMAQQVCPFWLSTCH